MNEEKIRIMQMVKDGTISPEEGLDLIEALGKTSIVEPAEPAVIAGSEPLKKGLFGRHRKGESKHCPNSKAKWTHIEVNDDDGKVNIKVPLSLAKLAGKFILNEAKKELKKQGIEFDLDGILSSLKDEGETNLVEVTIQTVKQSEFLQSGEIPVEPGVDS